MKKRTFLPIIWIALFLLFFAACENRVIQPADHFEIIISNEECQPMKARVRAGDQVSVRIINNSSSQSEIAILIYPEQTRKSNLLGDNTFWKATIQPGFEMLVDLGIPQMAGEYDLVCRNLVDGTIISQGYVTVVQNQ